MLPREFRPARLFGARGAKPPPIVMRLSEYGCAAGSKDSRLRPFPSRPAGPRVLVRRSVSEHVGADPYHETREWTEQSAGDRDEGRLDTQGREHASDQQQGRGGDKGDARQEQAAAVGIWLVVPGFDDPVAERCADYAGECEGSPK